MSRKNNIEDMTIREQLENIYETFCHEYCKHYAYAQEKVNEIGENGQSKADLIDKLQEEINQRCEGCPLSRI